MAVLAVTAAALQLGVGNAGADPNSVTTVSEQGTSVSWSTGAASDAPTSRSAPAVTYESVELPDGAQTLIHINSADAPNRFEFPVTLPENARLESMDDGSVSLNVNRLPNGGFQAPWAKDAAGNDIPTRLEIEGTTLVQIVDFDENTQFPVVADPRFYWGIVSGHAWFNREETRVMAEVGAGGIGGLPWLALVPPPFSAVIASNLVNISAWAIAAQATGKCLALKFGANGSFWPPAIGVAPLHHTGSDCY